MACLFDAYYINMLKICYKYVVNMVQVCYKHAIYIFNGVYFLWLETHSLAGVILV